MMMMQTLKLQTLWRRNCPCGVSVTWYGFYYPYYKRGGGSKDPPALYAIGFHFEIKFYCMPFTFDFYSSRTIVRVAVNMSKCMYVCMYVVCCMLYVVWYVKFKGSLLVEAVQSRPLIGRHDKGSSDVTVTFYTLD